MAHYADGYVVPVPVANLDASSSHGGKGRQDLIEHGALEVWECAGDDVKPGKLHIVSAKRAAQVTTRPSYISWILYDSRESRDRINKKVMEDPRMKDMMDPKTTPFDCGKRMFWGGFKSIVELSDRKQPPLNSGR